MALKINPITGKFNLWKSDKPSTWNANSNANDYTTTGVYHFAGYRLNNNDNLPIDNYGEKVNIAFSLIVDNVDGFISSSTHVPAHVSQTLMIGNRQGSETKIYIRNATMFYDGQPDNWEPWKELVSSTYLGIADSMESEVLMSATEIGLYTGAIVNAQTSTFDVFKLEVINNHALSAMLGMFNSILQTITILKIDTTNLSLQRFGVYDGSKFVFSKWQECQSLDFAQAKQNELGLVKGGQNVFVNADGSINVTQIINEIVDNSSDGVLSSLLLKINQNLTIEEAKHTYIDRGAQETVTDYAERQIDSVVCCTPDTTYNDYRYVSAQEDLLPNTTKTVIDNIWLNALNLFNQLVQNEYKDYNYLQELQIGLARYPYYTGKYIFHIKLSNPTTNARVFLKNKFGEIMGEFSYINSYERELQIGYFLKDGEMCMDLSKILPFSIQITSANETYIYDGVQLTIRTWQKGSTEVYDDYNSRYLYGRFQKSIVTENAYQDYTKNIAICRDGLLIQGRNQHLYFRVNDEGNIETNINELL